MSSPRRTREATSPPRRPTAKQDLTPATCAAPRLADLAEVDKEKIAIIVKQFTDACQQRDELSDVVKEQESQLHHFIRERWSFTQENSRLAQEVEQLRQRLTEVENTGCEQVDELRSKTKKLCDANRHLSAICYSQKEYLSKQKRTAADMEMKYTAMVTAMRCLEFKLENSRRSIKKLKHHMDNARDARCFPAQVTDRETQTEHEATPAVTCYGCAVSAPAVPAPAIRQMTPTATRAAEVASSGPLSQTNTRKASDVSSGPLCPSAAMGGEPARPTGPPLVHATEPICAANAVPRPHGGAPQTSVPTAQVTCDGSGPTPAGRWTLTDQQPGPAAAAGLLQWAAGAPAADNCPCWHQTSPAGRLALSPQAVEDWMLSRLFFSGRQPCAVSHATLQ